MTSSFYPRNVVHITVSIFIIDLEGKFVLAPNGMAWMFGKIISLSWMLWDLGAHLGLTQFNDNFLLKGST